MRQIIAVNLGVLAACVHSAAADPLPVNIDDVEMGPIRFQLIHHGKEAGEMYFEMERRGDNIVVHDGTTLLPSTRESLTGVFDTKTFTPKSILVDGDFSRTIFEADLTFADGKASGVYILKRPSEIVKTRHPFEADMPKGSILRAAFYGLVTGLPLDDEANFKFTWFSVLGQKFADVEFTIIGRETVDTPAGSFDTYVGELKAQPENILYITRSTPHKVVRIDVVGQDMRFERLGDEAAKTSE